MTWTSPFTFTGNVSVQWLDIISDNTEYFDLATLAKFCPMQFYSFWDVTKSVYSETRDGYLPDRFSFAGIGNSLGYPPGLVETKVLFWRARTPDLAGQICIEQGDMTHWVYDWVFDEPAPTFSTTCWEVKAPPISLAGQVKIGNYSTGAYEPFPHFQFEVVRRGVIFP